MKRTILLFLLSLSFIVIGCDNNKENYEPNASDYVEWDNSYFYYANYRCKTDLTSEEKYITEIEYEGKVYSIDDVIHYQYKDNKLHMTFYIEVGIDSLVSETERCLAYTIYSLDNEEVEYLYIPENKGLNYEIDFNKIVAIDEGYTIFAGINKLIKIDLNTNEIKVIDCNSYEVKNGYVVIKANNELLSSSTDEFDFESIMSITNNNSGFNYFIHNIDDKPYLQIIDQTSSYVDGQYINANSLTYYDFFNKKFYEVVKFSDNKVLSIDTNKTDKFILGEETFIEYNPYTSDDQHLEYKSFRKNNVLCTVSFNMDKGVELLELYTFNSNEGYHIYKFEDDNIIQLSKVTLNKPNNHLYYNRIDTSLVYFDINKLDFLTEKEHNYDKKIIIAKDDGFIYYFKTKKEQWFLNHTYHYYLYRLDINSNKEGLLAYFNNHSQCVIFETYFINNHSYTSMQLEALVRKD